MQWYYIYGIVYCVLIIINYSSVFNGLNGIKWCETDIIMNRNEMKFTLDIFSRFQIRYFDPKFRN